jgi:hypothetical protein
VADLAGGAVCRVELSAAIEELGKFGFECGQLTPSVADLGEFGFEE